MEKSTIPKHVAMIPDGNRRWAKERGEKPWVGHEAAAKNFEHLLRTAHERDVEYFSLWGSSLENLEKRPLQEKKALLRIYEEFFTRLLDEGTTQKYDVRIRVLGRWRENFPQSLVNLFERGIEQTKGHTTLNLTLFLAYSGDDEMHGAIQKIIQEGVSAEKFTKDSVKKYLMTHDLPPVDYLIRTGGEPHLSVGFMMWDIANAQLFFTEKLCPDFDAEAFGLALDEYATRARRHGS